MGSTGQLRIAVHDGLLVIRFIFDREASPPFLSLLKYPLVSVTWVPTGG